MSKPLTISAADSRRLLMSGLGLLENPLRPCTPASLYKTIEQLGFVQLDTISTVERAHNHILWTRLHTFTPAQLDALQRKGKIFEHFTHDASLIPCCHFPHWRHRFNRVTLGKWINSRLGPRKDEILAAIRARIEAEGPLLARDFEDPDHTPGTWWHWKPSKAALEYLWRSGELTVPRREKFQKVYDFTHRALPHVVNQPPPSLDDHIDWACTTALSRLVIATPTELAQFWNAISIAQARQWCKTNLATGKLIPITQQLADNTHRQALAFATLSKQLKKLPDPAAHTRLLSPFDPLIRDRKRLKHLFGFDYRFEAFVPAPKRKYGYYVLPILRGDQLIARLDPQLNRDTATLTIRKIWPEPNTTRANLASIPQAIEQFANFCNAKHIILPPKK